MIELIVLNYLKLKLNVPVVMENIKEDEYVLIEKTGSGLSNHIKNTTFAIQSYSNSLYNAALLNEEVKKAMIGDGITTNGIVEDENICSCELNTDYNFTDTTTKHYRYQAVFDVVNY